MSNHLYKYNDKYIKTDKWLSVNSAYNAYNLTLETNDIDYGTLTADKTSGYYNDVIIMTPVPTYYYQFDHYDVTGGDISNNNFTFSTNDATAKAYFSVNTARLPYFYSILNSAGNITSGWTANNAKKLLTAKRSDGIYTTELQSNYYTMGSALNQSAVAIDVKYDNAKKISLQGLYWISSVPDNCFNNLLSAQYLFGLSVHPSTAGYYYHIQNIGDNCFNNLVGQNDTTRGMFAYAWDLTGIGHNCFDNLESNYSMFGYCSSLELKDYNIFPKLKSGTYMFQGCRAITSLYNNQFPSLESASNMFVGCINLKSISNYSFSSLKYGYNMFGSCSSINHNVKSICDYLINKYPSTYKTAFKSMFYGCKSIPDRSISSQATYSSFF